MENIRDRVDWDDDTWRCFIEQHWEKVPVKLSGPEWAKFCCLAELFEVLIEARGPGRLKSDRFWVSRAEAPKTSRDFVFVDLDLFGPQPADGDLNGFFERMSGRSFGINLHRLDKWGPRFRHRLSEPIDRLSKAVKTDSVARWDLDCFLGTYRMTPFGVHQDQASVFSWCLQGERTYLTWPPDYPWPEEDLYVPDESRLQAHLDAAERFKVGPGELFYWPSNRWHVVCSDGRPSVVVQFSAYFEKPK